MKISDNIVEGMQNLDIWK